MKRTLVALLLAGAGGSCHAQDATELTTPRDKASYGIGVRIGTDLLRSGLIVDPEIVAAGIRDALQQAKPAVSEQEFVQAMEVFQKEMTAQRAVKMEKIGQQNLAEGPRFLAKNREQPGVEVTNSGLQYQVLKEGTGRTPQAADTVVVHYHGQLLDGTVFDSSVQREVPVELPVSQVIPGWTEALQLMKVGSKWRLFIPPELGYGETGSAPTIGPHATLLFSIELLEVKQPEDQPATSADP